MTRRRRKDTSKPKKQADPPFLSPAAVVVIRGAALVAVALSGYLIFQKATGQISSIVGCGEGSGCAEILGGRWSSWFHIPVTVPGLLLYLGVFIATLPAILQRLGRIAYVFLATSALIVLLSAAWFVSILVVVEKTFCIYCTAVHAIGLLVGATILPHAIRARRFSATRIAFAPPLVTAVLSIAILAAGQVWGPRPPSHQISHVEGSSGSNLRDREVRYLAGQIQFSLDDVPLIGSPSAPLIVAEYFDYTCRTCRIMHRYFRDARQTMGDRFAIIAIPCPLNRKCNRFLRPGVEDHQAACELARYSLAVWRADPAKFYEFHNYLMAEPLPADLPKSRRQAIMLVGEEAFFTALTGSWVGNMLAQSEVHYSLLTRSSARMPIVILKQNTVMRGIPRDSKALVRILNQHMER